MKRKVRIVSMPKAQSGLAVKMNAGRAAIGLNANQLSWPVMAGEFSAPDLKVAGTIQETNGPFNIEAEKGETIFQPAGFGGIPAHFKIGGKKHYDGGTKLNAPPDSFIFSDHSSMKIKDGDVQKMFGKTEKKSGYTPADIAKQYDINKYVKILRDPDSDRLQRETAEMMITNYNLKLGKLALAQESIKGFPQGIPAIAMPYMMTMNIDPNAFTQTQGETEQPAPDNMSRGGIAMQTGGQVVSEIWQEVTGTPWKKAKELGYTDGSFEKNLELRARLLKGEFDNITIDKQKNYENKKQSAIKKQEAAKAKVRSPKFYSSEAEYKAHLLDPWSPEKQTAQLDWINKNKSGTPKTLPNKPSTAQEQQKLLWNPEVFGNRRLSGEPIINDPRQIPQSGVVVDKYTNQAYYFGDQGQTGTVPVLTGKNIDLNYNPYPVEYLDVNPQLRNTPRGYYIMETPPIDDPNVKNVPLLNDKGEVIGNYYDYLTNTYGGKYRDINPISAYGMPAPIAKDLALHRTPGSANDPEFIRRSKLYAGDPNIRCTSYGCVNTQDASYDEIYKAFPTSDSLMVLDSRIPEDARILKIAQSRINQNPVSNNYKKGGSYVPKAQRGLFNRPKTTMRYNPQSGAYEVLDENGNIVGFGNPGPQYPTPPPYGGYPPMGGGMGVPPPTGKSGTEASRTVKKQDIPKDSVIIKRSDYKTEQEYIEARDKAYQTRGNKKVYTQGSDGKYYKVAEKASTGTTPDENLTMLSKAFTDPAVKKALYEKTLAAAQKKENLGKNPGFTVDEIKQMGEEGVAAQFLEMQNRNVKLANHFKEKGIGFNCFDNLGNTTGKCKDNPYKTLDDAFKGAGVTPPAKENVGLQQISYIGYRDLLNDKNLDESLAEKLKPFDIEQGGVNDEKGPDANQRVSKADGVYTNTTAGQVAGIRNPSSIVEELAEETEEKVTDPAAPAQYTAGDLRAPWWLQDIVNIAGKFGDWSRLRKRYPNLPVPEVVLPEGVFADPNRALAANAEQANIMAQNLAAFQGPQALSSRSSQIQGQAARQAADIMGRYDTMNVGIANQLESQRSQILNAANTNRANIKAQEDMYNAIVDQNFQNAETAARDRLRQSYINAMNNRWTAFNVNQLTDQYKMHPEIGGGIFFEEGRPVEADSGSSTSISDAFLENRQNLPGVDDSIIWQITKNQMGVSDNSGIDPNYQAMLQAQSNMYNTSQGQ